MLWNASLIYYTIRFAWNEFNDGYLPKIKSPIISTSVGQGSYTRKTRTAGPLQRTSGCNGLQDRCDIESKFYFQSVEGSILRFTIYKLLLSVTYLRSNSYPKVKILSFLKSDVSMKQVTVPYRMTIFFLNLALYGIFSEESIFQLLRVYLAGWHDLNYSITHVLRWSISFTKTPNMPWLIYYTARTVDNRYFVLR